MEIVEIKISIRKYFGRQHTRQEYSSIIQDVRKYAY